MIASLPTRAVSLTTGFIRRVLIGRVPKLFDAAYYLRTNRDVARSGIDPFLHFVLRGAAQDRDPAPDFDTRFYRSQSGPTRLDPVRHYIRIGAGQGLDPHPAFNTLWYTSRHTDVARSGINPLLHHRTDGRREGRSASRSTLGSPLPHMLEGVPSRHILHLPLDGRTPFGIHLDRTTTEACPDPARRLCLFLRLTDAEILGLPSGFAVFERGSLQHLDVAIDPRAGVRPTRPTLLITFEHCYHGTDRAGGGWNLHCAETRLWDLRPQKPTIAAIFAGGRISVRPRGA